MKVTGGRRAARRAAPLLVQIFLIHYGLGQFRLSLQALGLWGFFRAPFWCAVLAITFNTAAYGPEIIRGGLQTVPHGQIEAARACGMSRSLAYRRVILPIALRQALPSYGNEIILMIKGTSLTSIITLLEITGIAEQIISQTYRAVEVFACAGALYLAMNYAVAQLVAILEPPVVAASESAGHRDRGGDRRRPALSQTQSHALPSCGVDNDRSPKLCSSTRRRACSAPVHKR